MKSGIIKIMDIENDDPNSDYNRNNLTRVLKKKIVIL